MGKYLYGLIDGKKEVSWKSEGINGEDIFSIPYGNVSMVASNLSSTDFKSLPKDQLMTCLGDYQSVSKKIIKEHDFMPMSFGTMVQDDQEIIKVIKRGYDLIKKNMNLLKGRIEFDLAAEFSNIDSVLKEIGESEQIREFKEMATLEKTTDHTRIILGRMVKEILDKEKKAYAQRISKNLCSISEDLKVYDFNNDNMIFYGAFLIRKENQPFFEKAIDAVDLEFEDRVNFRLTGPLPYYSFKTLMISRISFDQIDAARKTLNLPEISTRSDIKDSYKRLCLACHPDLTPQDKDGEKKFLSIEKAYQVLMDFSFNEHCSFAREDVEDWVKIGFVETNESVLQ